MQCRGSLSLVFAFACVYASAVGFVAGTCILAGDWISSRRAETAAVRRSAEISVGRGVQPEQVGPPCCGIYAVIKVIDPRGGGVQIIYERIPPRSGKMRRRIL